MTKLKELPPPLARQIVFRFVGAGLSLFACICSFLLYGEPYLSISLLAIALVVGISGAWFYYTVATGQYVVVEGRCQKVEQTYLFRKTNLYMCLQILTQLKWYRIGGIWKCRSVTCCGSILHHERRFIMRITVKC